MTILLLHSLVLVLMSIKLVVGAYHLQQLLRQAMTILLLYSLVLVLMSIKLVMLVIHHLQQLLKAGHDNIVAILIGAGADVNKAGDTGATPLIAAA